MQKLLIYICMPLFAFQTQRSSVEHKEVHPQQAQHSELHTRSAERVPLEQEPLVAHRPREAARGHGWCSGVLCLCSLTMELCYTLTPDMIEPRFCQIIYTLTPDMIERRLRQIIKFSDDQILLEVFNIYLWFALDKQVFGTGDIVFYDMR